ncbi:MAG: hypothetical protein BWY26_01360 [Elusimicrobia bacterium ADurb.Bin231]|nr:MAG: hypothetical protein BWY26_01360 [Elusimicrobia bacterium ADurb.Bin231]
MDELVLITCIVQRGKADRVVKESLTAGAEGVSVFYGRGTGLYIYPKSGKGSGLSWLKPNV